LSRVESIEWREISGEISSPTADGEIRPRAVGYDGAIVRGKLTFSDPVQASSADGLFGTLTADLQGLGGGPDRRLTITNVQTGGASNLVGHNRAAICSVPFQAASSDGVASPVTLA